MTAVKIKTVKALCLNGTIETEDKRYNTKRSVKKVVSYCIKHKLAFKFKIKDSSLIDNPNYIEVYDDWFIRGLKGDLEPQQRTQDFIKWLRK